MLFDTTLLFFHATNTFQFTSGEYVSLVGDLATTGSCTSSVINLGVAEDAGIGDGEFIPKLALYIGNAITTSCSSVIINFALQGSTNSTVWTTFAESGYQTTASYQAGAQVLPIDIPKRPAGFTGLPQYYQVIMQMIANPALQPGVSASVGISTGSIIGGIVIQRADADNTIGQYASGFTVA